MAGPNLPTNIDTSYPDSSDPSVKLHQQYHDAVHGVVNAFDTSIGSATAGQVPVFNGTTYTPGTVASPGVVVTVAAVNTPTVLKSAATYVCDGVADQVEIQAALDGLPVTGGWVQLLSGTFTINDTIRVEKHGTTVAGHGMSGSAGQSQSAIGTRILLASGFAGTAGIRFQDLSGTNCISHVGLRDLTVDGGNVGVGIDGIFFRAHTSDITRVRVSRMTGEGIQVEGYSTWNTYDTMLSRLIVEGSAGDGILFGTYAADDHVMQSVIFGCGGAGIRVKGASHQFTGNHTYSNLYGIWFDNNGSRTKVLNHKCEQSAQHGFFFDNTTQGTSDVQIVGCNFKNNGQSLSNTYDHINFGNLSTQAHTKPSIVGCNFSIAAPANGNLPRYCVNAPSSAVQQLNLVGNNFPGASSVGTAILNVASTATVTASGNAYGASAVGRSDQRGVTSVANGGLIPLNLARTPSYYTVSATGAGHVATVTAASASALTVGLVDMAGVAVTTAENVTFQAEI